MGKKWTRVWLCWEYCRRAEAEAEARVVLLALTETQVRVSCVARDLCCAGLVLRVTCMRFTETQLSRKLPVETRCAAVPLGKLHEALSC